MDCPKKLFQIIELKRFSRRIEISNRKGITKYDKEKNEGVVIADLPWSPIEKRRSFVSVLALIIIYKYVEHLPLYRQIEMFKQWN